MQGLCPSDDVLAALVQQALVSDESEHVRSHIDECDTCARIVVAAIRGRATSANGDRPGGIDTRRLLPTARVEQVPIGATIGRYEVRSLLGAGGMGRVYEAYDAELDRAIALKVLRPELAIARSLVDRLVRESRLMAKISHPAVITVHDVGREGDAIFIAMELVGGETLGAYVERARPPWRTIVELYERAGAGLAAAHRAGVVHRDFKPDNVLVELEGGAPARVVVTDFGVARTTSLVEDTDAGAEQTARARITQAGSLIGTPAYMAPEQLAREPVDRRADVFAFCVSLWEGLFGTRPFPGTSAAEIQRSMKRTPRAPRRRVPRALVRTLARGLALDPRDRPQDLEELLAELARHRIARWRRRAAVAVATLLGGGIALTAFVVMPDGATPCATETLRYDEAALAAAIADRSARADVVSKIGTAAAAWRSTNAATCNAGRQPAQPPRTAACLDARRIELLAVVDDFIRDRGAGARARVELVGDPARCVDPAPGLLTARAPTDIALRRRVSALRHRASAAKATRDGGDIKGALVQLQALAREAEATWPLVHAEVLFLLGTTQGFAGQTKLSTQTLQNAAAVADAAHHDDVAAHAWIELAMSATTGEGVPGRGLEYATYADAALERLGRPPHTTSLLEYAKGAALTQLSRFGEAEAALRRAVELAETHGLDTLPEASLGLGYLYEAQGRFADAVEAYRTGLDNLTGDSAGATSGAIIFRQRIALNLAWVGDHAEAERVVRAAIRIAEDRLEPEHVDRAIIYATHALVLQAAGRDREALDAIRIALQRVVKLEGERSPLYGELTKLEANILGTLDRFAESARRFDRACDILAFHHGEDSRMHAECSILHAMALHTSGDLRRSLALIVKAAPVVLATYTEPHPQIANVLLTRGTVLLDLGRRDAAVPDLERAAAQFEKLALDPGHLAGAQFVLAKALWPRDRARARALLDTALATFETASPAWTRTRDEARTFLVRASKRR
jgi:eukaryotic-like serine/threonine-protein kinase